MSSFPAEKFLLHPETRAVIHRWLPEPKEIIDDALQRAGEMCIRWNVRDLVPLAGGAMSVIARGKSNKFPEWDVIVKAPLMPDLAVSERDGLTRLEAVGVPVPMVLAYSPGVLLMRAVPGRILETTDAHNLARALQLLHDPNNPKRQRYRSGLPSWNDRREQYFDEYARRISQRAPHLNHWVSAAQAQLPGLLMRADKAVLHGDLQGKNVLLAAKGLYLIDPISCEGSPAWDAALASAQVAASGGDPSPILMMSKQLAMRDLAAWTQVAVVSVGGTTAYIENAAAHDRLTQLLISAAKL